MLNLLTRNPGLQRIPNGGVDRAFVPESNCHSEFDEPACTLSCRSWLSVLSATSIA